LFFSACQAFQRIGAALAAATALACLPAAAADRVALLIGNNNYGSTPLRNATNDAKDLGDALKELGFQVIVRENATRKDMIEGIREFAITSSPSTPPWEARRTSLSSRWRSGRSSTAWIARTPSSTSSSWTRAATTRSRGASR
jgi:hypothetical protein